MLARPVLSLEFLRDPVVVASLGMAVVPHMSGGGLGAI